MAVCFVSLSLSLTGCFVVRIIKGDPDKGKPDANLPEMPRTVNTNIFDPEILIPFDEVKP